MRQPCAVAELSYWNTERNSHDERGAGSVRAYPGDKRAQAKAVGDDLVDHHSKRKSYTVEQVRQVNRRQHIKVDVICWSHAMFNSH